MLIVAAHCFRLDIVFVTYDMRFFFFSLTGLKCEKVARSNEG